MQASSIYSVIKYSSALSIIIPLIACLIKFKTFNVELKVLFFYIIVASIIEGVGFYLWKKNIETYIVQNVFTFFEFTLILTIYYLLFERRIIRLFIFLCYLVFVFTYVYVMFISGKFSQQDNILNTFEATTFMILAYYYFYKVISELQITNLSAYYFTWINTAFLIYFSAGFVMFLFNEYIENLHLQWFYLIYCLYLVTSLGCNLILTIGIWKIKSN